MLTRDQAAARGWLIELQEKAARISHQGARRYDVTSETPLFAALLLVSRDEGEAIPDPITDADVAALTGEVVPPIPPELAAQHAAAAEQRWEQLRALRDGWLNAAQFVLDEAITPGAHGFAEGLAGQVAAHADAWIGWRDRMRALPDSAHDLDPGAAAAALAGVRTTQTDWPAPWPQPPAAPPVRMP